MSPLWHCWIALYTYFDKSWRFSLHSQLTASAPQLLFTLITNIKTGSRCLHHPGSLRALCDLGQDDRMTDVLMSRMAMVEWWQFLVFSVSWWCWAPRVWPLRSDSGAKWRPPSLPASPTSAPATDTARSNADFCDNAVKNIFTRVKIFPARVVKWDWRMLVIMWQVRVHKGLQPCRDPWLVALGG